MAEENGDNGSVNGDVPEIELIIKVIVKLLGRNREKKGAERTPMFPLMARNEYQNNILTRVIFLLSVRRIAYFRGIK